MRAIHWFRGDLRRRDNRALARAAREAERLCCVFVLDEALLASPATGAPRVRFLLDCLARLGEDLAAVGQRLVVRRGDPARVLARLVEETQAERVTWNRDTSPYARRRDARVRGLLERAGARIVECKDRVVFEGAELRTRQGRPYAVYSPFRRAWWERWANEPALPERAVRLPAPIPGIAGGELPSAEALGFGEAEADLPTGGEAAARRRLRRFLESAVGDYARDRDRPAVDGTSRLSPYLRFGALSVRDCFQQAEEAALRDPRLRAGVRKWQDELVWREFYAAILEQHPRVLRGSFRAEYQRVAWNDDPEGFRAWSEGRTGFPIVDAGMRQLRASGWMPNRVRMLAASFLSKDLLIDWRRGERLFFRSLVDGDPASNNGGWQWAASTGTDPQPYFRIFNPTSQGERCDPDGAYVRSWVPELAGVPQHGVHRPWEAPEPPPGYPAPILDHAARRREALRRYRKARG